MTVVLDIELGESGRIPGNGERGRIPPGDIGRIMFGEIGLCICTPEFNYGIVAAGKVM